MTSPVGHLMVGAACYLSARKIERGHHALWCALSAMLACAPDMDYLVIWTTGWHPVPRASHSISFCLALGMLAWASTWRWRRLGNAIPPWWVLLLAPQTHLLLDLAVAGHALPLCWPLTQDAYFMRIGMLPGAVHPVSLRNPELWRKLVVESGVLWPMSFVGVLCARHQFASLSRRTKWLIALTWLGFLTCSLRMPA